MHLAVDAHPKEAQPAGLFEGVLEFALALASDGRQQLKARAFVEKHDLTNDLIRCLPFDELAMDGTRVANTDLLGKYVLLDFFSVADKDCLAERPALSKLFKDHQARDFTIVSVSLDVDADRWFVLTAADKFDMNWKILFDGNGPHSDLAKKFGVRALPARLLTYAGVMILIVLIGDQLGQPFVYFQF